MSRPILISLSPNAELDDIAAARQLLHDSSSWADPAPLGHLEHVIENYFPDQQVAVTSSGRSALYAVLQAAGIGAGDEVIIQAFTCVAVPAPITWVGATPIFADIQPETYNLDPASVTARITSRTRAIIVQHTFGMPGPIDALKKLARDRDILLIEDCAHALGGTYEGEPLGSWGDVAILSFGRDKTISSVFGGAVISRNSELIEKIKQQQVSLLLPPQWWVRQQLWHPVLFDFITRWYFTFGIGKACLVIAQKLGLLSKAVSAAERQGKQPDHTQWRLSPALAQLATRQFKKLARYTKRRQAIAARYMEALNLTTQFSGEPNWLRFPLQVADQRQFLLAARRVQMLLGDWYDAPVVPGESGQAVHYESGSCPVAEHAASHVVNLPTYPLLTDEQVEQIISFAQKYVTPR